MQDGVDGGCSEPNGRRHPAGGGPPASRRPHPHHAEPGATTADPYVVARPGDAPSPGSVTDASRNDGVPRPRFMPGHGGGRPWGERGLENRCRSLRVRSTDALVTCWFARLSRPELLGHRWRPGSGHSPLFVTLRTAFFPVLGRFVAVVWLTSRHFSDASRWSCRRGRDRGDCQSCGSCGLLPPSSRRRSSFSWACA